MGALDRVARYNALHHHRHVRIDDRTAVERSNRKIEIKCLAQCTQAKSRAAACQGEQDAMMAQYPNGGDGGRCQALIGCDESAVDVGDEHADARHEPATDGRYFRSLFMMSRT